MNNWFCLTLLLAVTSVTADAQTPTSLVKSFPANAGWTVKIKSKIKPPADVAAGDSASVGPQGAATKVRVIEEIDVDKMGTNRREVYRWSNSLVSERWYYDGMVLIGDPASEKVVVMTESRIGPLHRTIFPAYQTVGDFPELAWISAANFRGEEVKNGKTCRRYELTPPPDEKTDAVSATLPMTAWIDVETMLPVATETATETRTYHPRSLKRAEMPANYRKALDKHIEALAR